MEPIAKFSNEPEVFDAANKLFGDVEHRLGELLPQAQIHHVGSTAIRGSLTKGDLDVLVQVKAADFVASDATLASIYDRNVGSSRNDAFSSFVSSNSDPHLGIQLVISGSEFDTFLEWRDLLRGDQELLSEYEALKRQYSGRPMHEYRAAKARFIASRVGN